MKYVLAISGGVDSVVLLDMVAQGRLLLQDRILQKGDCVVAHFDHGIRSESSRDAELVKRLAAKYQMEFILGSGELGKNVSEQLARTKRYDFLRSLYKIASYRIITAHHQDDLLETVIMNLIRGTGWRGLAPFWSDSILRPLLSMTKVEIVNYAVNNNLKWAEDETNYSAKYFRNRVRDFISYIPAEQRRQLLELNKKQTKLRSEIEIVLDDHCKIVSYRKVNEILRLSDDVALEILRQMTGRLTLPQLKRLLKNLRDARSGDIFQPGDGLQVGIYHGEMTVSKI